MISSFDARTVEELRERHKNPQRSCSGLRKWRLADLATTGTSNEQQTDVYREEPEDNTEHAQAAVHDS